MSSVMEELLKSSEHSLENLKEGELIKGTVMEVRPNEVVVDIGGKSEGSVPASEFVDASELAIGEEIELLLEKLEDKGGNPIVSFDKAQQKKNWENIINTCEEGAIVQGRVKGKTKGGLIVSIGVDAFLPSSQIDVIPPASLDPFIGQTYDFKVVKINLERKNIVVSRRELIEEERNAKRQEVLAGIEVGVKRRGVVKNITDYGAFVDLDGMDGLLHVTDMSWGRIAHPSEVVKVGEEVTVMVLEVDQERERISLGMKQAVDNPWENIQSKYPIGTQISGKVTNLVAYGAFIEIEQGIEGLVHVSELSWTQRVHNPRELLKVGQQVDAVVLDIQEAEQKVSLGIRQLEENPWEMVKHNYPVGAHVRGKVRNLTTYGAFIELEPGIDGMVHVSDMSWTRKINNPSEFLTKDEEVDAVVLDIDTENHRIALGIKQLSGDPWDDIDRHFKVGDVVKGKVSKVTNYGAFVELQEGIDGLVHISQISEERVEKVEDAIAEGSEVEARVIKIDRTDRRIGLSIKAADYDQSALQSEVAAYDRIRDGGGEMTSLGDLIDQATQK